MNDTNLTVIGNIVDEPRTRKTQNGHVVSNFRVATTSRRFDREHQRYVDNQTLYVNVSTWRGMAENVHESLHKGQPVIVTGRYYMREYTVNEQVRTSYELEATAVGHDLARGVSRFERKFRPATPAVEITRDEQGIPVDDSDHWLHLERGAEVSDEAGAAPSEPADDNALATVG